MAKHAFSPVSVQRAWRREYESTPTSDKTIRQTYKRFKETGSIHDLKRDGRPRVRDEVVEAVREHYEENPNSSLRQASREMDIPYERLRKTLKYSFGVRTFDYTLVQELLPDDHLSRKEYCELMKQRLSEDQRFLDHLCFSDETKFCLNTVVKQT